MDFVNVYFYCDINDLLPMCIKKEKGKEIISPVYMQASLPYRLVELEQWPCD